MKPSLSRKLMGWAALPVTDRRWAAPLSAAALGFGLFIGVALSPGAADTLAGGRQVIELPPLLADSSGPEEAEAETEAGAEFAPEAAAPAEVAGEPFEASAPAAFAGAAPEVSGTAPDHFAENPAGEDEAEDESPPAEGPELSGIVVHVNSAAGSYTVAEAGGVMTAVHSARLPAPGTRVEVPIETLANGTLAEDGKRAAEGTVKKASLTGIVTFADPDPAAPAYTVSNRGVSVLVHVRPDPAGTAPELPVLGAYASVAVEIEAPVTAPAEAAPGAAPSADCLPDPAQAAAPPVPAKGVLWQRTVSAAGAPFPAGAFEGIVAGICPQSGQILISADDIGEAGSELTFSVPSDIKPEKLRIGDSVLANAEFGADGSLTLTGLASDELVKGADDAALTQGDLVAAKGGK